MRAHAGRQLGGRGQVWALCILCVVASLGACLRVGLGSLGGADTDPGPDGDEPCGASCGDGICCPGAGEDPDRCGADCAASCGDGRCDPAEDPCSCEADCGAGSCGDGYCCSEAGEDETVCPADCVCVSGCAGCVDGGCCTQSCGGGCEEICDRVGCLCIFDLTGATGQNEVDCMAGTDCEIDCTGAANCDMDCFDGARCILYCAGSPDCTFDDCTGGSGIEACPGDVLVCNRPCP